MEARKPDYRAIVAKALVEAQELIGGDQDDFGTQLGAELSQQPIARQQVSAWQTGRQEPRSSVLVAAARLVFRATQGRDHGVVTLDHLIGMGDMDYRGALYAELTQRVVKLEKELRARD